jgi:hypothetical protein
MLSGSLVFSKKEKMSRMVFYSILGCRDIGRGC